MREITMDLWCELDEVELRERALQMSSAVIRLDEVEAAKKDANKEFGEQIAAQRADQRRLSTVIRNKRERRPVMCFVEFHSPVNGTKRVSRSDTGEFVRDEPMTPFEMQEHLFDSKEPNAPAPTMEPQVLPMEITDAPAPTNSVNGFDPA